MRASLGRAMGRVVLQGAEILDPEAGSPGPGSLLLEGERIAARLGPRVAGPEDARRVDLSGLSIAPGLIDLHHHGRVIFSRPRGLRAALEIDAASLARHGTTAFLATTVS